MNKQILLIEDDSALAATVKWHLESVGYELHCESDGVNALETINRRSWDLVLLDIGLPRANGWDICRHLQTERCDTPIVMITGQSAEAYKVLGLELGAEDYLTKPFSMLELVARVRGIFRRQTRIADQYRAPVDIVFGSHRLNPQRRDLLKNDQLVQIARREFDLLWFLAKHPRRVFTRADLLSRVWGNDFDGQEHAVNSQINRLRSKIESDPICPAHILTVWGVGYQFELNP